MYPSPSAPRPALWQFGLVFSRCGLKCHYKSPLSPIQYIDVTKWSIALSNSTTNTVFKALSLSFFSITTPFPALLCSPSPCSLYLNPLSGFLSPFRQPSLLFSPLFPIALSSPLFFKTCPLLASSSLPPPTHRSVPPLCRKAALLLLLLLWFT